MIGGKNRDGDDRRKRGMEILRLELKDRSRRMIEGKRGKQHTRGKGRAIREIRQGTIDKRKGEQWKQRKKKEKDACKREILTRIKKGKG